MKCDSDVTLYDYFSNTYHVFKIYSDTIHSESVYYDNGVRQVIYPYKGNKRNSIGNSYLYDRNGLRRGSNVFRCGIPLMVIRQFDNRKWSTGVTFFKFPMPLTNMCFDTIDNFVHISYVPYNDSLAIFSKGYTELLAQLDGRFINGKPDGQFTSYHRNGQLRYKLTFENGYLKTIDALYSSTGETLTVKKTNINSKRCYTYLEFEDSTLFPKKIYDKLGYYENYHDGIYKINYNNSDSIRSQFTYVKGIKEGDYKEFHDNGKISCIGQFKFGMPSGIWKYWDINGNLIFITNFETGYS